MSAWWRDHFYPHMARLMDTQDAFKNCTQAEHNATGRSAPLLWGSPPELYAPLTMAPRGRGSPAHRAAD
jgi:hypothetical protein